MSRRAGHRGDYGARGVSVAIACYNGARYLPALLDSVIAQTIQPAEIVCSDDASTDDTINILEDYQKRSSIPIKIIRHDRNVGIIENFLAAFRAVSSDLVAYCDQDDVWLEEKLETCLKAFGDEDIALVCHTSQIVDANLGETGVISHAMTADKRLAFPSVSFKHHAWGHQMVFVHRTLDVLFALYRSDAFRDSNLGTCFDFGVPFAASLVGDIYVSREPLVKFRRHAGATSRAGKSSGGSTSWQSRLSTRAHGMKKRARMIDLAISAMGVVDLSDARDFEASRVAYVEHGKLVTRRASQYGDNNLFSRMRRLPSITFDNIRDRATAKDFVADIATAFCGAPAVHHEKVVGNA